jgi:hypothetical protein
MPLLVEAIRKLLHLLYLGLVRPLLHLLCLGLMRPLLCLGWKSLGPPCMQLMDANGNRWVAMQETTACLHYSEYPVPAAPRACTLPLPPGTTVSTPCLLHPVPARCPCPTAPQ